MAHQSERNIPHLRDIFGFDRDKRSNRKEDRNLDESQIGIAVAGFQQLSLNRCFQNSDKSALSGHDGMSNGGIDRGNDSAISVGSTSEEDISGVASSSPKKKKQQRSSRREKVVVEPDVKHLERHLSMKKTIRKKIMRDLQQAFVEDPNEFRVEDISPEQLKAEINVQSLSFGTSRKKKDKKNPTESNFLDFLRAGSGNGDSRAQPNRFINDDEDSGHGSPTRDLSSERFTNYEYLQQQQRIQQQQAMQQRHQAALLRQQQEEEPAESSTKKTSFWKRLTTKGSRSKR